MLRLRCLVGDFARTWNIAHETRRPHAHDQVTYRQRANSNNLPRVARFHYHEATLAADGFPMAVKRIVPKVRDG
jgi:hypothetical protein